MILCAPVCARSSRLSQMTSPSSSDRRAAYVIGVGRPTKSASRPPSSARNAGSSRSACHAARARPAPGSGPRAHTCPRRRRIGRGRRDARARRCSCLVSSPVDQLLQRGAGVGRPHQRLAHQDGRRAGGHRGHDVGAGRIPLSRTATRSRPIRPSRRSAAGTSTSSDSRSRAFTPITSASVASARSRSSSECVSTSGSDPEVAGRREHRGQLDVGQAGRDQQHGVGARGARLDDLGGIDQEVLPQDRDAPRRREPRGGRPASRRSAWLGEHRDDRGPARVVGARLEHRVGVARSRPADGEARLTSAITATPSASA